MEVPKFKTKKELFSFLRENAKDLIWEKKAQFKKADSFSAKSVSILPFEKATGVSKSADAEDPFMIKRRLVINTTFIMDSHKDVHIDGLWNKNLKENNRIKHLQEHEMKFDKIISDKEDLKAFVKTYDWRSLGYDADGKTQALVFDSVIKSERNPFMFNEYLKGNVDNHSVGMQYVSIKLAFDSSDEDDAKYKETWDKYIDKIVNREDVERNKYFYAILEAKAIEGSAVVNGSNPITPTLQSKEDENTDDQIENPKEIAIKKWLSK